MGAEVEVPLEMKRFYLGLGKEQDQSQGRPCVTAETCSVLERGGGVLEQGACHILWTENPLIITNNFSLGTMGMTKIHSLNSAKWPNS